MDQSTNSKWWEIYGRGGGGHVQGSYTWKEFLHGVDAKIIQLVSKQNYQTPDGHGARTNYAIKKSSTPPSIIFSNGPSYLLSYKITISFLVLSLSIHHQKYSIFNSVKCYLFKNFVQFFTPKYMHLALAAKYM